MTTPTLYYFRVTYDGRRPRGTRVIEMTATVLASDEADARRVFFRERSHRHVIKSIVRVVK